MKFDLIGDIHGHGEPLVELLEILGYRDGGGIYRHPGRRVIFLGDFIDRGPDQRGVIDVVRPMIEAESALAVMGNHEFNAIAYHAEDPESPGNFLRVHSDKNVNQHQAFLGAYRDDAEQAALVGWFRSLPLWLDLPGLRVVHACWDRGAIACLDDRHASSNDRLSDELLVAASRPGTPEYKAVEILLKGKEIPLPEERMFHDKDGHPRHDMRLRWWDGKARTYRDAFLGPETALPDIPEEPLDLDGLVGYSPDDVPVFIGHYWMVGEPRTLAPNVACLDYSIAAPAGGKLVAYRWDGEQRLQNSKFLYVERKVDGP